MTGLVKVLGLLVPISPYYVILKWLNTSSRIAFLPRDCMLRIGAEGGRKPSYLMISPVGTSILFESSNKI